VLSNSYCADLYCILTSAGGRRYSVCGVKSRIQVHHLLSLHLKLLLSLLLLLLLDELRVQFSSACDSDDGRTEMADRVLGHCRQ